MILFHNDYSEGCHENILKALCASNLEQTPGYGCDDYCARAADKIRKACQRDDLAVHFMVGGTQVNLTVIAAALRPHQAAVGASTAHINVHETGAIEATGHKVIAFPYADGKLPASQVEALLSHHRVAEDAEHMAQPKLVYISSPTELGTVYTLQELEDLHRVCQKYGLYLFLDGARLGYGLAARENDATLADLARLCDVFYIGGTKVGALFGEAIVISNPVLAEDFRYIMKQRGGMLAKGRLLGIQFDQLFENDLYYQLGTHAVRLADQIRQTLRELDFPLLVESGANQIFPILPDALLAELGKEFTFSEQERIDDTHRAVRFCTSWASREENVRALCAKLRELAKKV